MERPYKVLVVMMWSINLKGAVIIAKLLILQYYSIFDYFRVLPTLL